MAIPDSETIAKHLYRAAESRAFERHVRFAMEVVSYMQQMASQGAKTILSTKGGERHVFAAIRVGSYAMVVFVDEMADQRLAAPNYTGDELTYDLWGKVRDILCPIWPIC